MDEEKEMLRAWVMGGPKDQFGPSPEGWVRLEVTSAVLMEGEMSSNNFQNFPLDATIADVKDKAMLTVGTSPVHQKLHLLDQHGNFVVEMADESALLRSFNPQDGWRVHVYDTDPFHTVERYQDLSSGPKYIMSDDEYRDRKGTFREWKLANPDEYMKHFGHLHPAKREDDDGKEHADAIAIGNRCRLVGDRRGEVMWVGQPEFSKGWWVGIKLDEPSGKNDGTVKGKRYFTCDDKFGIFVKAEEVETGDFPPLGLTLDSDDEI